MTLENYGGAVVAASEKLSTKSEKIEQSQARLDVNTGNNQ